MTEPYLILHKVRGEPAFDIAVKLDRFFYTDLKSSSEEKIVDPIWIIPTSGHRAYPFRYWKLEEIFLTPHEGFLEHNWPIPTDWPDHYSCNSTPKPKPPSRVTPLTTDDFLV